MPAEHYIDKESKLIITTWVGEATDSELIESFKKYQEEIQNHPDNIDYNEVLDLTGVTISRLTTEGIIHISQLASMTDRSDSSRKLAIIVKSNFVYGLARMYEIYRSFSNKSTKEIRIFKDGDEAYEWIKSNP